jgi:hypothetical protein
MNTYQPRSKDTHSKVIGYLLWILVSPALTAFITASR